MGYGKLKEFMKSNPELNIQSNNQDQKHECTTFSLVGVPPTKVQHPLWPDRNAKTHPYNGLLFQIHPNHFRKKMRIKSGIFQATYKAANVPATD